MTKEELDELESKWASMLMGDDCWSRAIAMVSAKMAELIAAARRAIELEVEVGGTKIALRSAQTCCERLEVENASLIKQRQFLIKQRQLWVESDSQAQKENAELRAALASIHEGGSPNASRTP